MADASTPRLRVLFTNFRSPWDPLAGGGQTATDDLARALCAAGHEVQAVFAGRGEDAAPAPYAITWVRPGVRAWATALSVAGGVREVLSRAPVDVVHTTGYEGAFVRAGAARRVATLHSPQLPPWQPPPWYRPLQRALFFRRTMSPALERRCLARADLSVFVSDHSRDRTQARGYPFRESVVLPNGVDTRLFRPLAREGTAPAAILFVGRFDEQKGVDVLLHAWRALDGEGELRLVGTGWREERCRTLARDLGLRSVRFDGHRRREELPALIQQARALVLPSRYENFPLVLLEAMACGVPVIATRVGGIPELVTDEADGLLVAPEHPEDLASAMRRLLGDPDRAAAMGRNALRTIAARFTWDIIAAKMAALYARVVSGASRPAAHS